MDRFIASTLLFSLTRQAKIHLYFVTCQDKIEVCCLASDFSTKTNCRLECTEIKRRLLPHMLDSAKEAVAFAAGKSRKDLDDDRKLSLATIKSIEFSFCGPKYGKKGVVCQ